MLKEGDGRLQGSSDESFRSLASKSRIKFPFGNFLKSRPAYWNKSGDDQKKKKD